MRPSTLFIIAAQGWPPAVSKTCPRGPDAVIRESSGVTFRPSSRPEALPVFQTAHARSAFAAPFLAGRPFAASPSPHSASLLCPVSRSGFCVASLILQSGQVATPWSSCNCTQSRAWGRRPPIRPGTPGVPATALRPRERWKARLCVRGNRIQLKQWKKT